MADIVRPTWRIPRDLYERLKEWQHAHRYDTQTAAVIAILEAALAEVPPPERPSE